MRISKQITSLAIIFVAFGSLSVQSAEPQDLKNRKADAIRFFNSLSESQRTEFLTISPHWLQSEGLSPSDIKRQDTKPTTNKPKVTVKRRPVDLSGMNFTPRETKAIQFFFSLNRKQRNQLLNGVEPWTREAIVTAVTATAVTHAVVQNEKAVQDIAREAGREAGQEAGREAGREADARDAQGGNDGRDGEGDGRGDEARDGGRAPCIQTGKLNAERSILFDY